MASDDKDLDAAEQYMACSAKSSAPTFAMRSGRIGAGSARRRAKLVPSPRIRQNVMQMLMRLDVVCSRETSAMLMDSAGASKIYFCGLRRRQEQYDKLVALRIEQTHCPRGPKSVCSWAQ
jgi:hypothetical protein